MRNVVFLYPPSARFLRRFWILLQVSVARIGHIDRSRSPRLINPGHFQTPDWCPQYASACAIAINVIVHSPNESEKSSIDVLSPPLCGDIESRQWLRTRLLTGFESLSYSFW